MKVKTTRAHGNAHGDKYAKAVGDEYELPDDHAKALIAGGLVEKITAGDQGEAAAPEPAKAKA